MTTDKAISTIAIIGNALELWSMAALLSQDLPPYIRIVTIDTKDATNIGPAVTLDCDNMFHQHIGVNDADLILDCDANLSLGTSFEGWQGNGSHFFSAPSGKLPAVNGVMLHHIALRAAMARREPEKLPEIFSAFRFPARAGLAGKLTHAASDPQSPRTMLRPLIHLDTALYIEVLKAKAATIADQQEEAVTEIDVPADNGAIRSIKLANGEQVAADLFVDLSGSLRALMPDDQRSLSESPIPALPFDRILTGHFKQLENSCRPYAAVHSIDEGVLFETPLRNGVSKTLLYASQQWTDEQAQSMLAGSAGFITLSAAQQFKQRQTNIAWTSNLICAGTASGTLGPYLSADMRLLQRQALTLSALIPVSRDMEIEASEYNRLNAMSFDQLRDFFMLPFVLNLRSHPVWEQLREADVPESLKIRINQFKSRGRFVSFDAEIFEEQEWTDMMIGFGLIPERHDPMARAIDMARIGPSLGRMVDAFQQTIDAMPTHQAYMDQLLAVAAKERQSESTIL